jgi:molecular chaperone DnaK
MGTPQIEVGFNLDANGILQVSAKDKGTGKEQKITIQSSGGLSKDEIEKMRRDAESHAADDKAKRDLAEAKNLAEQRVYQLEKLVEENKDTLSEGDRTALEAAIARVVEAKKGDDAGAIQRAVDDLQKASQAMAEHLYASNAATGGPGDGAGAAPPPPTGDGPGGKPDDVIDVEFDEKK